MTLNDGVVTPINQRERNQVRARIGVLTRRNARRKEAIAEITEGINDIIARDELEIANLRARLDRSLRAEIGDAG
jgi:hypothetical protein